MCVKRWYMFFALLFVGISPVYMPSVVMAEEDDSFGFMDDLDGGDEFTDADNTDFVYTDDNTDDVMDSGSSVSLNDGATVANVGGFDIAGIMLGMSFEDVYNLYHDGNNLYAPRKRNSLVYTIPQDWKYNLDYECRQAGVVQPTKLDKCVRGLARSRGLLYVSEIHLERVKTGETIDVYLTSNATDNVVYRVMYKNDADDTECQNQKCDDQREKKILAFWKTVIKKYGAPNSGQDTWITSTNPYDPKMVAYYGALELMDDGRRAMDAAQAAQQSRENFRAKPYAF
ncbi:MAG: hypothetical protein IKP24_04380 [Alphaproteobacteria bacterium]|nr:hypothetical protein [Alphaproteobacteria bacterium]